MNTNWFYKQGNVSVGPVSEEHLRESLATGKLPPKTMVWREGLSTWMLANECPLLDFNVTPPQSDPEISPPEPDSQSVNPSISEESAQPAIATQPQFGMRFCKQCGGLYSLWSLHRAMGSGLCVACSGPDAKAFKEMSRDSLPALLFDISMKSRGDALKAVHFAALVYFCIAAGHVALAFYDFCDFHETFLTAGALMVCGILILWRHSRGAAVILLGICIYSFILMVVDDGWRAFRGFGLVTIGLIIVTLKATLATFILHGDVKEHQSS